MNPEYRIYQVKQKQKRMAGSGLSVTSILGIIFVTLKLLEEIDWPWLWVTAPFWGPIALFIAVGIFIIVVTAFFWTIKALWIVTVDYFRNRDQYKKRK